MATDQLIFLAPLGYVFIPMDKNTEYIMKNGITFEKPSKPSVAKINKHNLQIHRQALQYTKAMLSSWQ